MIGQPHARQHVTPGRRPGNGHPAPLPLVMDRVGIVDRHREDRRLPLDHNLAGGLRPNHRLRQHRPERHQARLGNRFLDRTAGELPADRQVVAAAALLHQGLDIVHPRCVQPDHPRLLAGVLGPLARRCPVGHGGDVHRVGRGRRAAQVQHALVIAGDPKHVIARRGRNQKPTQPLAVIVQNVGRRLELGQDLGKIRLIRVLGAADQVGQTGTGDSGEHLAQQPASMNRGAPTASGDPGQRQDRPNHSARRPARSLRVS